MLQTNKILHQNLLHQLLTLVVKANTVSYKPKHIKHYLLMLTLVLVNLHISTMPIISNTGSYEHKHINCCENDKVQFKWKNLICTEKNNSNQNKRPLAIITNKHKYNRRK